MRNGRAVGVAMVVGLAGLPGPAAWAQAGARPDRALVVIAHRDLQFGAVIPGIASTVPNDHPRFAGEFEIQGAAGLPVRMEFLLPAALTSAGGALMPIVFASEDGRYDFSRSRSRGVEFDPKLPLVAALGPNARLHVWLGGTVLPTPLQPAGRYRATISVTVFNLGT